MRKIAPRVTRRIKGASEDSDFKSVAPFPDAFSDGHESLRLLLVYSSSYYDAIQSENGDRWTHPILRLSLEIPLLPFYLHWKFIMDFPFSLFFLMHGKKYLNSQTGYQNVHL